MIEGVQNGFNKLIGCACILIIGGPILIIVGISFLASSTTDSRGSLVTQYITSVNDWKTTGYNEFASSNITASMQLGNLTVERSKQARFTQDSRTDYPADWDTYRLVGNLGLGGLTTYNGPIANAEVNVMIRRGANSFRAQFRFDVFGSKSVSVSCTKSESRSNGGDTTCRRRKCEAQGGNYSGTCKIPTRASEVCISITPDPNLSVQTIAPCYYGGTYARYLSAQGTSSVSSGSIGFTIMSAKDPYLKAEQLTKGSLSFGLTQGEKRRIGAICIGVGIALMIPLCCLVYFIMEDRKKKRLAQANAVGLQPVYPMQPAYGQPAALPAYPPQGQQYPPAAAYPQQYPPQQGYAQGYPPQSQGYPPQSQGYPPQGQAYPSQGQAYPSQGQAYPSQPQGYPPQQGQGYPSQGYPQQQQAYPQQGY